MRYDQEMAASIMKELRTWKLVKFEQKVLTRDRCLLGHKTTFELVQFDQEPEIEKELRKTWGEIFYVGGA